MAYNVTNPYDLDAHIAEIYDQTGTEKADIQLLRRLIPSGDPWSILEPFTGTGRILLPLAIDGHEVTGIDRSPHMIARARQKVALLPEQVQYQVVLVEDDALEREWQRGYDLVILGGNCLYELATAEEQETIIRKAARSLKRGGFIFVDSDHTEGDLGPDWQMTGERREPGLSGACEDGSKVESYAEITWVDAPNRLVRLRRRLEITTPGGETITQEYEQQKHLASAAEVRGWLEQNGFEIQQHYGDYTGSPYTDNSPRAIFWARKG